MELYDSNYTIKEKIVKAGGSEVFKNWKEFGGVSEEDFLDGLKWVCDDPMEFVAGHPRMTRELALDISKPGSGKLVRLERVNDSKGGFVGFYRNGMRYSSGVYGFISINREDRI